MKKAVIGLGVSSVSLVLSLALVEAGFFLKERVEERRAAGRFADLHPVRARPAEEFLILGIGESTMMGGPYDNDYSAKVSPLRIVKHYLERADPRHRFLLERHAGGGRRLGDMLNTAVPVLSHRPDLIIIAAGHNDFMSGFPPDQACESYRDQRTSLIDASATYRFFKARFGRRHLGDVPTPSARRLFDAPIACPADWRRALEEYERSLEAIAGFAGREQIPIIFVSLAADEASWSPNRSAYYGPEAQRATFETLYRWGRYYLEHGALGPGRDCLEEAVRIDPAFGEAVFRLAEIYRAEGADRQAQALFEQAKEHDAFPWRMLNQQRASLQRVAERHHVPVVDVRALLLGDGAVPPYLDRKLFHDIHHPAIRGYNLMAQHIVRAIAERQFIPGITARAIAFDDDAALLSALGFDRRDWTVSLMLMALWHDHTRYYVSETLDRERLLLGQLDLVRLLDPRLFAASFAAQDAKIRQSLRAARAVWDMPPPGSGERIGACRMSPVSPADGDGLARSEWDEQPRTVAGAVKDYPWFQLALESTPAGPPVHISGVPSVYAFYASRPPQDGAGADGAPLTHRGRVYDHGFVTHPFARFDAEAVFEINGRYRRFDSELAIGDTGDQRSSVVCGVFGEGKRLFQSPVLRWKEDPVPVSVDVSGVRELELTCMATADGDAGDHAAWLNPTLTE